MKKITFLLLFIINSYSLFAQTILTIEGTVVNNTQSGSWGGVSVPRNIPTTFTFRNNSITSLNSSGYLLQAGDEGVSGSNNNLNGEIISGNKFTWNGIDIASTITHGLFTGYNINCLIKHNYLFRVPTGIVLKSNGMTYTSGGVAYNIINKTGNIAVAIKGMNGVLVYNNTFYSNEPRFTNNSNPGTDYGIVDIFANDGLTPWVYSTGAKIKNNIFYTVNQIFNITIENSQDLAGFESDYNIFYCENGVPLFNYLGSPKTFTQWQALGYDTHSVVINPNFNNLTDFVPASRLNYGTNLGTTWQTGLSTRASWIVGTAPETSVQNGSWQVGARIYSTPVVPVSGIVVTGQGGATTITADNGSLQVSAAVVPTDASDKTVTWTLVNSTGQGTINSTGLVTAINNGTVSALATANDGSGIIGTLVITISNQIAPDTAITVTSPNGGEIWQVGSINNITWTSVGTSGTVRLEYSTNNGTSWTTILANTPDDGTQAWTIPDIPSTTCLVRASDTDGSPVDVSNAVFSIVPLPSGPCINETFTAATGTVTDNSGALDYRNSMTCDKLIQPSGGGTISLIFTAFNTEANYDFVRVYNGSTTSAPLLGTFSGSSLPPVLTANSGSMLIRFTTDGSVVAAGWSANYTSVIPQPSIAVTSPNGGEIWQVGSSQNITWTSVANSGTVLLEYSTNNGTSWTTILASTPDDGTQAWTIPDTPSTTCLVRVSDTDGSPVDVSNAVFSIVPVTSGACINETFTAASGTVTDNSGALDYRNNMTCDKLIQPSGGGTITLTFTSFSTEAWYDFVRVYNGTTTSAPLLGSFSGNALPRVLTANSGSMLIRFTTDGSVVAAGWSANYITSIIAGAKGVNSSPVDTIATEQINKKEIFPENNFVVYPNPTSGILTIKSSLTEEETYTLDFINTSGQVLLNKTINVIGGKFDLDISDVSYGIYLLEIRTNRIVQYMRVIKN